LPMVSKKSRSPSHSHLPTFNTQPIPILTYLSQKESNLL